MKKLIPLLVFASFLFGVCYALNEFAKSIDEMDKAMLAANEGY